MLGAPSTTPCCTSVEHVGGRVVAVDAAGAVDLDALADALDESVRVVSVMAVNNEVGTISPLAEVAAVVRERAPGAVLHTDAVQGLQWLDLACRGGGLRPGRGVRPQVRRAEGGRRPPGPGQHARSSRS